jgi:hypothetical protein
MIMMCVFQCCAYLCHTQEETPSKQPAITTNYTHERHDSAPTEHEDSHPVRRPHLFEDDLLGTSRSVYGTKNIVTAVLYCSVLAGMCKSFVMPAIFAFPTRRD